MSTQIQRRRGTTAEHSTFTGVEGELTVDTTKDTVVVHDGATTGGRPLLREDQANLPTSVTNGISVPSANNVAISTNGTGRLFVDASGNVGVGAAPEQLLHLGGNNGIRFGNTGATAKGDIAYTSVGSEFLDIKIQGTTTGFGNIRFFTGATPDERLRITADGKVGIGTTTVARGPLHLNASADTQLHMTNSTTGASDGDGFTIAVSGSEALLVQRESAPLSFYTASTERLRITADGKVGIGATSVGTRLHVSGTQGDNSTIYITSTDLAANNGGIISIGGAYDGSGNTTAFAQIKALKDNANVGDYGGSLGFFNRAGAGGLTEKARIDSSGRLLVGTSSSAGNGSTIQALGPNAVEVFRYSAPTGNSGPNISLTRSASNTVGALAAVAATDELGQITFKGAGDGTTFVEGAAIKAIVESGTISGSSLPTRLVFATTADGASSPTERMRIDSSGNLLLGTASQVDAGLVSLAFDTGVHCAIATKPTNNAGYDAARFFNNSSGQVGSINCTTTSTAYNTSSDYRLKENVVPLIGAADRLKQIPVHRFNFIADPDTTVDGFIAHEAQAVVPECVTGTKDEVDADGNPVYQGIDQSKLVPLLTSALQEALQKIETLEQRLNDAGIA